MIKVLLALLMIRETWRFKVVSGALRVLYRNKQAYNKHSTNAQVKLK